MFETLFPTIGGATVIVAGLAGFNGWQWWIVATCVIVATIWYTAWGRDEILLETRLEGASALLRHYGSIVIVLGAAWLIGYGLSQLF